MGQVMSGARAKVALYLPSTGLSQVVGIFSSIDYGLNYQTEPAFTLGRFSAAANDYVSQDIIGITCSGFRVIKHGPFVDAGIPALQDLLLSDYIQLSIIDRQTELLRNGDARMAKFFSVRPTGFTTGMNGRSLSQITFHYQALNLGDESLPSGSEGPGATTLPVT
jgi:hypothetical protein